MLSGHAHWRTTLFVDIFMYRSHEYVCFFYSLRCTLTCKASLTEHLIFCAHIRTQERFEWIPSSKIFQVCWHMAIINSIYVNHKNIAPADAHKGLFWSWALAQRIRRLGLDFFKRIKLGNNQSDWAVKCIQSHAWRETKIVSPLNVNLRFSSVLRYVARSKISFYCRSRDGGVSAEVSMPAEASSMYRNLPAAPHKRPDPVI